MPEWNNTMAQKSIWNLLRIRSWNTRKRLTRMNSIYPCMYFNSIYYQFYHCQKKVLILIFLFFFCRWDIIDYEKEFVKEISDAKAMQGEAMIEAKLIKKYIEKYKPKYERKRKRREERLINGIKRKDFNREDSPMPRKKPRLDDSHVLEK